MLGHVHNKSFDPVAALDAYWRTLPCANEVPLRADVHPRDIPPKLHPYLVLIEVEQDPVDFLYRRMGTEVVEHMLADHTGKRFSDLSHQQPDSRIWQIMLRVTKEKQPITSDLPYVGPHKEFKSVQDIICPLSHNGVTVCQLMVALRFSSLSAASTQ